MSVVDARPDSAARQRLRIVLRGAVQGVGFRPFVYRLASSLGLTGLVANTGQGLLIEAEGDRVALEEFRSRLERDRPRHAIVTGSECARLDPAGFERFEIRSSVADEAPTAFVLPDIATCADCLRELFDPRDRRYGYPFINCTHCGPRFTIIEGVPYDRQRTSMKAFEMCAACAAEFDDPDDRRFHAQPNACPACGPSLALWDRDGAALAQADMALDMAADAIDVGGIVAIKGLGGFLLVADARSETTIRRLRELKRREEKPFALMFPSLADVAGECEVSTLEARVLAAPESPIVLLRRRGGPRSGIAPGVARRAPELGAMLPYAPLHHLLMRRLGYPVVATSGNLRDEPICTDENEALSRLRGMADVFLVHDRAIVRHVDDSIVRVVLGREMVLRRARGYAPLPIALPGHMPATLVAGAHLKSAPGVTVGRACVLSQHIGDLETMEAVDAYERAIRALGSLHGLAPVQAVVDLHPDYGSTRYASRLGLPLVRVQHHAAHLAACMAENELDGPVLGVVWDGTGYGTDGTVWGGEFLVPRGDGAFDRVATLRSFRLPGGDRAIREPRRAALGVLYELYGDAVDARSDAATLTAFGDGERRVLLRMLARGINAPVTTSAGRLFDAAASLAGVCQRSEFEGHAAMELAWLIDEEADGAYTIAVVPNGAAEPAGPRFVLDWRPAIESMLGDIRRREAPGTIASRFHGALADAIVATARHVGLPRVALTGGCFQNRFLLERTVQRLSDEGFRAYWHQRVPTNDGGIAYGQAAAASMRGPRAND